MSLSCCTSAPSTKVSHSLHSTLQSVCHGNICAKTAQVIIKSTTSLVLLEVQIQSTSERQLQVSLHNGLLVKCQVCVEQQWWDDIRSFGIQAKL